MTTPARFHLLAFCALIAAGAAHAEPAVPAPSTAFQVARADLLQRLAGLKQDNLYLRELVSYQAALLKAAKADPKAVLADGRRPLAACEDTRIAALCGLFGATFAPLATRP